MTVPTPSRRQFEATARTRISKREVGTQIENDFVKQGLEPEIAKAIVDEAVRIARTNALRLLVGSSAFAGLGLLVTVGSYSAAKSSPYGGTYFFWFGPMIAGGIVALVALRRFISIRR